MSSLNIKNEETVRLIRELADKLGVSMTAAVTDAVQARLKAIPKTEEEIDAEARRIHELFAEIGDLPGVREYLSQDFDEILYDEMGLPK
jgi:antitoxin VapB